MGRLEFATTVTCISTQRLWAIDWLSVACDRIDRKGWVVFVSPRRSCHILQSWQWISVVWTLFDIVTDLSLHLGSEQLWRNLVVPLELALTESTHVSHLAHHVIVLLFALKHDLVDGVRFKRYLRGCWSTATNNQLSDPQVDPDRAASEPVTIGAISLHDSDEVVWDLV